MNKLRFWIQIADWSAAGLCLLAALVFAPDGLTRIWVLANGLVWAGLSWKLGLSFTLTQFLLLIALRLPQTAEMSAAARAVPVLGGLAWGLAFWKESRWVAIVSGLLWTSLALLQPGLWPLVLAGYPRLGRTQGDFAALSRNPGILLLLIALAAAVFTGQLPVEFRLPRDPENYSAWLDALARLFTRESLWIVVPLVGVFEVAQSQPSDLRVTWRNLTVFGMLASALFFAPNAALALFYWTALPLSAILLTRWTLALPGWPPRVILWVALVAFAGPVLQGGHL
jgi:hypothetical protein